MKTNNSIFVDIRGLRYHCRIWGETGPRATSMGAAQLLQNRTFGGLFVPHWLQ